MKDAQLPLVEPTPNDDLLGARWACDHGDVTVIRIAGVHPEGFVRVVVERPERGTAFDAVLPVEFARRELAAAGAPTGDVWLPVTGSGGRDFYNDTRHQELVALGLVPPVPELAGVSVARFPRPSRPEARHQGEPQTRRRPKVATKKKASALAGLPKTKLRAHLLSVITIPDKAWNAAYGAPAREKGETREQYIRRVLA